MKKRLSFATLGAAFLLPFLVTPTMAESEAPDSLIPETDIPGTISANIALTTDYMYRGISQTSNGNPAVQGGFDYGVGLFEEIGFYLGTWASNIDFDDGPQGGTVEIDYYGGLTGNIQGVDWSLGGLYYQYPGADQSLNYDFIELTAALGYDFEVVGLAYDFAWSPEFFGEVGDSYYHAFSAGVPLPRGLSLDAGLAYQGFDLESNDDYWHWTVGLTASVIGFDMTVAYHDADESDDPLTDARAVFTIARAF